MSAGHLPALLAGVTSTARSAPHRAALVTEAGAGIPFTAPSPRAPRSDARTALSFGRLHARIAAAASGLMALGLRPGDRTVLLVPPGPDFAVAAFALLACGAVPVLVDPGIGLRRVRRALTEVAPVAFIGSARAHIARRAFGWAPTVRHAVLTGTGVLSGGPTVRSGIMTLDRIERMGQPDRPWRPQPADADAAVLFTSGSTGTPKGVVYRHPHFAAQITALQRVYDLRPGEVNVATFPPFALLGPALGMTTVLPRMDFTRPAAADPRRLFAAIDGTAADVLFASPALLDVLAGHGERTGAGLPSLRLVLSAGAPVPVDLAIRTGALLSPSAVVSTPYGMTEALPVCTIGGDDLRASSRLHDPPRGICVGHPVPGTTVVVAEVSTTPERTVTPVAGDGVVGELVVSGPQVTETYVARPDATARAKTRLDGRAAHRTGDLGWRDGQGRIWFAGRVVHRVPAPSGPLDPLPIEQVVSAHPAVRRAALVAVDGAALLIVQPSAAWARSARWRDRRARRAALIGELRRLLDAYPHTAQVGGPVLRRHFPVDARHNAKVGYEQLARWAAARRRGRWVRVGRRAFGGAAT